MPLDNNLLVLVFFVSLICPPLATAILCGCTPDVLLNFVFCFFGWIPGLFHVVYLLFVAYDRLEKAKKGTPILEDAPLVFSKRIQAAGKKQTALAIDPGLAAVVEPATQREENVVAQPVPETQPEPVREGVTA